MRYRRATAFGRARWRSARRTAAASTARSITRSRSRRSSPTSPACKVVVPSTPYDAKGLLRSAIRDHDPVLFFEHKKMYRSIKGEVPDGEYTVPARAGRGHPPGTQMTIVAYGLMAHYALEAADRAAEEGISVEVVDLRTLRPLDSDTLLSIGPQDRQVPRRLRGQQVRRLRGGDRRHRRRGGLRLPRRPGHPGRRARGPGRPVQPRPRGLVHGQPGEDPGRRSGRSPPTEAARRGLVPRPSRSTRSTASPSDSRRPSLVGGLERSAAERFPGEPEGVLGHREFARVRPAGERRYRSQAASKAPVSRAASVGVARRYAATRTPTWSEIAVVPTSRIG